MIRLSSTQGIGGIIKETPEDFLVEEIAKNGTVLQSNKTYDSENLDIAENEQGKFCTFVMQKTNWNTVQALTTIAKLFRRGRKSIGFAGTKDRCAISVQLCSIFGANAVDVQKIRIKDISINGAWNADQEVKTGDLIGNRFGITIRESKNPENFGKIVDELAGVFPNYFGEQRFGFRDNNVDIGLDIIKDDFKSAAMKFLTDTTNENNQDAVEARKRLADQQDFKNATEYFPKYLRYERSVIEYLGRFPDNYANAMRKLPRQIILMFVHSVEDKIFNMELENRVVERRITPRPGEIVCGKNFYGFPDISNVWQYEANENNDAFAIGNIVGYETKHVTEEEDRIMESMGLDKSMFKLKGMPELSCKGALRALFAPCNGISSTMKEDGSVNVEFSLPAGSYATIFLKEIMAEN